MNKDLKSASKTISYALRHKPEEFGIKLDNEGWTDFDAFCKALAEHKPPTYVDRELVEKIIAESVKKRFELADGKIRATYGHSTDGKIEFKESAPPNVLFHGTSRAAYKHICKDGLKPMSRQYVHLSADAAKMHSDGFKFFHSANDGTWMCEKVPSKYTFLIYGSIE